MFRSSQLGGTRGGDIRGLVAVVAQPRNESRPCRLMAMVRQSQDLTMPDNGNGRTEVDLDHAAHSGLLEILQLGE
ncbi:hypothetical protein RHGRI_026302 [Rhododendron griersonianum]|uniref:Uncharacterized protein n=1 Tax=Rhododendron griersonianum TaxID=479676 RepID=A0AAV6IYI2_9ERIC|nr:hypothetical protein RHGRI_026302 [Rhododendron griersonianum]